MKKTIFAAGLLAASVATAQASAIVTWEFPAAANQPVSTGQNNTFTVRYNSQSIVTDNGDGILSHGDTILSVGGFGALGFNSFPNPPGSTQNNGALGANYVTGFSPDGSPAPDFYNTGNGYVFSFYFNDLLGVYNEDKDGFIYTSGTIHFGLYSYNAATGLPVGFNNLFEFDIASGGPTAGTEIEQNFKGIINPLSLANGAGNAFSFDDKTLSTWLSQEAKVKFELSQTVQAGNILFPDIPNLPTGIEFNDQGVAFLAAVHDGSVTFSVSVPQPASITALALGLLGLRLAARSRKAKQ